MSVTLEALPSLVFGAIFTYAFFRFIYLSYFHPLSRFPGPRVAAVSNLWYAYHWLSGRYPWATEDVRKKYGDVVRIAPNELLFTSPQASIDIYSPHVKNHELFTKTDMNERGEGDGGILFERYPARHRVVSKQLSPAFSSRASMAKEPVMQMYIDLFIEKMRSIGSCAEGVDVSKWCNWLAMDTSADLAYNRKMNEMRDMKNSANLELILGFNAYTTAEQVSLKFPYLRWVLKPLTLLTLPRFAIISASQIVQASKEEVQSRIRRKGNTSHLDFFEQLVPAGALVPTDPKEMRHLEQVASQLLFAGYEPVSSWYYCTLLFLLKEPKACKTLIGEIRGAFSKYTDLTPMALASLKYLNVCLEESLRLFPSNNTGLPRVSPGAVVDGTYIPKGVYCQTSIFATSRNAEIFHDPLHFRPQRWLSADHPLYEQKYAGDNIKGVFPFSQGPRQCPGKEVAWMQARLFIAKVLWSFDLVGVPGEEINFERDFITYGFWVKPKLMVRFVPANRDRDGLA